jgi:hypothetical protein
MVPSVKKQIFKELDEAFDQYPVSDIEVVINAVEDILKRSLQTHIIRNIASFVPDVYVSDIGGEIIWHGDTLKIVISDVVLSKRTLDIALLLRNPTRQKYRFAKKILRYDGFGRYSLFRVNWPKEIDVRHQELLELIQAIVATTYFWLEGFVSSRVTEVETELAHDLYAYARATFQCGAYLQRFWFVAVKDEKGYCLFDHRAASEAVLRASRIARGTELIPSAISTRFVVNEADFELMVAKDAISLGKCVDVPFVKTKYRNRDFDFSEAEAAFHQVDSICLCPIAREGQGFLLAGFPTPSRPIFEPLLTEHSEEIISIFQNSFGTLKHLTAKLKKNLHGTSAGKIGEFLGGFTKALIDF